MNSSSDGVLFEPKVACSRRALSGLTLLGSVLAGIVVANCVLFVDAARASEWTVHPILYGMLVMCIVNVGLVLFLHRYGGLLALVSGSAAYAFIVSAIIANPAHPTARYVGSVAIAALIIGAGRVLMYFAGATRPVVFVDSENHCPHCGYLLYPGISDRCSECGSTRPEVKSVLKSRVAGRAKRAVVGAGAALVMQVIAGPPLLARIYVEQRSTVWFGTMSHSMRMVAELNPMAFNAAVSMYSTSHSMAERSVANAPGNYVDTLRFWRIGSGWSSNWLVWKP